MKISCLFGFSPAVEKETMDLSVPLKLVLEQLHLYLCLHTSHGPKGVRDYFLA